MDEIRDVLGKYKRESAAKAGQQPGEDAGWLVPWFFYGDFCCSNGKSRICGESIGKVLFFLGFRSAKINMDWDGFDWDFLASKHGVSCDLIGFGGWYSW